MEFICTSGFLALPLVVGCASVVPLNSGGEHVRLITADDAKVCKFIQNVAYTETSPA